MSKSEERYEALTIDEKIKLQIKKIKPLFAEVDKSKMKFVENLIQQFAFSQVTIDRLVKAINSGGVMEDFSQGSQKFKRESPALKSYNVTIKSYIALSNQLCDFLPEDTAKKAGEKLMNFATAKPPGGKGK